MDAWQAWLEAPYMPQELKSELAQMSEEEKQDRFYCDLSFGTGGLRGVLGAGSNRMNVYTVAKATRGLGRYLLQSNSAPSCAISFDSRIHSEDFARLAAAVLASMGITVYLYEKLHPTPMLSFAVRHLRCQAGVMITASHNPAAFNGYKVYNQHGCQITLKVAQDVSAFIQKEPTLADALPCFEDMLTKGGIHYIDASVDEAYYQCIQKLRLRPLEAPLHIVYSPLNGTGNVPVREMLRRIGNVQVDVVSQQEMPDGHFSTCPYPNPEMPEAMALASKLTLDAKAEYCMATDPDCDRIGVGQRRDGRVELISGNDMGVLLLDYICGVKAENVRRGKPFVAVKTIVTTEMAQAICDHYGVELRNVLTGFKFIGETIGQLEDAGEIDRYLFGFEESYGYLSGTDVRDKDAVNAAVLMCEMASYYKQNGLTLLERLEQLKRQYGFFEQRLLSYEYEGQSGIARMNAVMTRMRSPLEQLPDLFWSAARIDYLTDNTGVPASDVLSFSLPNHCKLILRPSGTEPKLKAYLSAREKSHERAIALLDEMERVVGVICE